MSQPIPYTLIRSRRRTLSLQVSASGSLIVRAPRLYPVSLIERFIMQKTSWIQKHQTKIAKTNTTKKDYTPSEVAMMKSSLASYITARTAELWRGTDLPAYTSIKITKSEWRWGSCSAKNGLCFSYRLAEYRDTYPTFIDAIIVHELAHLREKHHQKAFWDLVYSMMPEYEDVMQERRSLD